MPAPTVSKTPQPKAPPLTVGRYDLIGRGGIGISEVHRARDPEGGLVAVYLFPDEPNIQATLLAATEACATIDHPNVMRVFDSGRESGHGYLITEWVEGTTLARLLEQHGRLPEANVIRFLAQVGQALDSIRQGDIAPCSITTQNILIRNDGAAKIIPFVLPGAWVTPTAPETALVKPQFAAELTAKRSATKPVPFPELIFSLGTTLFEALTGAPWAPPEPPHPNPRRRRPKPRPLGLTDRTERAIARATDANPAKRPESCAEFVKLLRTRTPSAGTPKPDVRPADAAENRRGFVRYSLGVGTNCKINTSLFDMENAPGSQVLWPLVVQDVSASGIGILLARRCEPGTELSIDVPSATERAVRSLAVRVVRVRKDNFGHWMHGCAFLTPLDTAELHALLNQLGRHDPA